LNEKGIPTMVYYPIPMHKQKAYKNYCNVNITLDNSEKLAKQVFSLPIYPDLSENDQEYISTELLKILN
jgi:Predicted pyridoxal phosphate-dependent enzyme apparently involved in regulation of cell wall biogenesis